MSGFPTSRLSRFEGVPDPFREDSKNSLDDDLYNDENNHALPPFLAHAIVKDRLRRNYFIEDGGEIRYYDQNEEVPVVVAKNVYIGS